MASVLILLAPIPVAIIAGILGAIRTWRAAERQHGAWRRFQRARAAMLTREVEW